MQPNSVRLQVIASVPLDCEFWPENDGWTGECAELSVAVRGGNKDTYDLLLRKMFIGRRAGPTGPCGFFDHLLDCSSALARSRFTNNAGFCPIKRLT
jgi:hypothetical protein